MEETIYRTANPALIIAGVLAQTHAATAIWVRESNELPIANAGWITNLVTSILGKGMGTEFDPIVYCRVGRISDEMLINAARWPHP